MIILDKQIKKIKTDFQDTKSATNIDRIKNDLTGVHNTLAENIDLLLSRTGKLEGKLFSHFYMKHKVYSKINYHQPQKKKMMIKSIYI